MSDPAAASDAPRTVLSIVTGREGRPVTGGDTTILNLAPGFYLDTGHGPALRIAQLSRWLLGLSENLAKGMGEVLHHAEYYVTDDPAVVTELGTLEEHRDCEQCAADLRVALAYMEQHPGVKMLVGHLFWAG
jgi:hypothetical protein